MHRVAVIGAGPAGLMAAETLAIAGLSVDVYDRMPSPGRKFLLAGRGGLNLTHSEPLDAFLARYDSPAIAAAVEAFTPADLIAWCRGLGQDVFTGSSGRVFPVAFKATPLLRAWLRRLGTLGVRLHTGARWTGWDTAGALSFDGRDPVRVDATVLALGGASWPRLGSDGAWTGTLADAGVDIAPLRAANCGVAIAWPPDFAARWAGHPLHRVRASIGAHTAMGEAMLTAGGIEGGVIYALSAPIRAALGRAAQHRAAQHRAATIRAAPVRAARDIDTSTSNTLDGDAPDRCAPDGSAFDSGSPDAGVPTLFLDLRPDLDASTVAQRLGGTGVSAANALRRAGLDRAASALVRAAGTGPLAGRVKALALPMLGTAPIDRAISTAGGVRFAALDSTLMLRARPGVFVAGEMLDWTAPTGGYLLQAAFATGRLAAQGVLQRL